MSTLTFSDASRTAPDPQRGATGNWIQSPFWDAFWMFSAIWGCLLLYSLDSAIGWRRASTMLFFFTGLYGLFHSWSTTFMVLGSSRMREARAANRYRYLFIPIAIAAIAMTIGVYAGWSLRFPSSHPYGLEAWPWVVYLALFWVGHFWHFGKQDFGVLSLYRTRAGQLDQKTRQIDQAYMMAMMFVIQPVVYMSIVTTSPVAEAFYSYVPVSLESVRVCATGAVGLACVFSVVVVGLEIRRPNTSIQKLTYYVIMLAHPLVLYYSRLGLGGFYMIAYFWSHWFIAIGLVSRINSGHYRDLGYRPATAQARHFLTIGAICALIMFSTTDFKQFRIFSGGRYKEILADVTPEQGLIVGIFLLFFFKYQLLQY